MNPEEGPVRGKYIQQETGVWVISGINPEPWTAPQVSVGRRGGKIVPTVFKRESLRSYQEAVKEFILSNFDPEPTDCELDITFYFWRSLETERSKKADATNLQKSTEDALHDLLFLNDSQVQKITSFIVDQKKDIEPTIIITWKQWTGEIGREAIKLRNSAIEIKEVEINNQNNMGVDPESIF